jgi:hypothetical protein
MSVDACKFVLGRGCHLEIWPKYPDILVDRLESGKAD